MNTHRTDHRGMEINRAVLICDTDYNSGCKSTGRGWHLGIHSDHLDTRPSPSPRCRWPNVCWLSRTLNVIWSVQSHGGPQLSLHHSDAHATNQVIQLTAIRRVGCSTCMRLCQNTRDISAMTKGPAQAANLFLSKARCFSKYTFTVHKRLRESMQGLP